VLPEKVWQLPLQKHLVERPLTNYKPYGVAGRICKELLFSSKGTSSLSLAKEWEWRPCKQMMRKGLGRSFGDRCVLTKMYRKPRKHFVL